MSFIVVVVDQAGRTGLFDSHSTTRGSVIPAAVGSARPASPPDIARDRPRPFDEAHAPRTQVAQKRKSRLGPRSSRSLLHGQVPIVLLNGLKRRQ
jgi:hypothetical protein